MNWALRRFLFFEKNDYSSLSFPESMELMENWLTCRGICLLQLRNLLGVSMEQKQALEVVGCCEEEKNFFFGALKRAFKVLVVHEKQMSSHLHLGLSQMDVLWLEAEGSFRDASLISLLAGEKTPRRKFKNKKVLIEGTPPLKLIFTNVASSVFPSVDLGYGFQVDIPSRPLHPEAWVKVLSSSSCFEHFPVPCPQIPLKNLVTCPHGDQAGPREDKEPERKKSCTSTVQWEDLEEILRRDFKTFEEEEKEEINCQKYLAGKADHYTVLPEASKIDEVIDGVTPKDCHQEKHPAENLCETNRYEINAEVLEAILRDVKSEDIVTSHAHRVDQYSGPRLVTSETSRHVTGDFGIQQLTGDR